MWERRSHTLSPLNKIKSIQVKCKWTKIESYAFDEIQRAVARDDLLTYPDFNGVFKIHTDASDFQLGSVISQKGKPIVFNSRNSTDFQRSYTLTERDLLSIVETLN